MSIEQLVWAVRASTFAEAWYEAREGDGQIELAAAHPAHPPERQTDDRKLSYTTSVVPATPKAETEH